MIVCAAGILEPELLLSAAGKENLDLLNERLLAHAPETVLLLGRHGSWQADQLSVDLSERYCLAERVFYPDFQTIETIQRELRQRDFPLTLDSQGEINPVLAKVINDWPEEIRLIPLSGCDLAIDLHEELGEQLKDWLMASRRRIAILAVKDDEEAGSWPVLKGAIKGLAWNQINIADQAIFYGG